MARFCREIEVIQGRMKQNQAHSPSSSGGFAVDKVLFEIGRPNLVNGPNKLEIGREHFGPGRSHFEPGR